jgi:DnaJ-class molecular chaperone
MSADGEDRVRPGDEAPPDAESAGEVPCPTCGGSGQLAGRACPDCEGTGRVEQAVGGG